MGFLVKCREKKVLAPLALFKEFFSLSKSRKRMGYYFKSQVGRILFKDPTKSIKNWIKKHFLVEQLEDFIPETWGPIPTTEMNNKDPLTPLCGIMSKGRLSQ
ncbi:hypothetical protein CFOL_v3_13555 [Cephalotus follicularis]|uniref:Uncharacterized protein n=1 Tax=Cephalotus follicularis TaxID=3775 RepID=A0A1Q3BPU2_CEPFO|nr:hypothetical protein CFOL_v3_13555 [Cephalotus follicularis]